MESLREGASMISELYPLGLKWDSPTHKKEVVGPAIKGGLTWLEFGDI